MLFQWYTENYLFRRTIFQTLNFIYYFMNMKPLSEASKWRSKNMFLPLKWLQILSGDIKSTDHFSCIFYVFKVSFYFFKPREKWFSFSMFNFLSSILRENLLFVKSFLLLTEHFDIIFLSATLEKYSPLIDFPCISLVK